MLQYNKLNNDTADHVATLSHMMQEYALLTVQLIHCVQIDM